MPGVIRTMRPSCADWATSTSRWKPASSPKSGRATIFRLRGELRRGFGGHHGFIADLGADFVMRPADRWLVSIGPRISVADSEYMETFYGVNAAQSVRSGLLAYNPSGGFQKAGVIASANYQLTPNWTVLGFARYDRLLGEAADSPLVQVGGSENQFSTGLGVSYSFDVNLFR
jgi:outer membrane protein